MQNMNRKNQRSNSRWYRLGFAVVLLSGCQSEVDPRRLLDAGVPGTALNAPFHLASNVSPNQKLGVIVRASNVHVVDQQMKTAIEENFTLVRQSLANINVVGAWQWSLDARPNGVNHFAIFMPAEPLVEDVYSVSLMQAAAYNADGKPKRFRIGSLPIVRWILCYHGTDKEKTNNKVAIRVEFSESVKKPEAADLAIEVDGVTVVPEIVDHVNFGTAINIALNETSLAKTYALVLKATVESPSGVKLDGKHTGKRTANGSDFKLTFVPATTKGQWLWDAAQ